MLEQLDVLIGLCLVLAGASLIVTLIVQGVIAFMNLRGTNLLRGVQLLVETLDPQGRLAGHAREVALAALRHPLISDSIAAERRWLEKLPVLRCWSLATSVQAAELVAILERLSDGAPDPAAPWKSLLAEALRRPRAGALLQEAAEVAGAKTLEESHLRAMARSIEPWLYVAAGSLDQFQRRFDSAMARTAQRFTTHTRIATVLGSFALALVCQLDVLDLQARLSAEPALRQALILQAQEISTADPDALDADAVPRALASVLPVPAAGPQADSLGDLRDADAAQAWLARYEPDAARRRPLEQKLELALLRQRVLRVRSEAAFLADLCVMPWSRSDRCEPMDVRRHLPGMLISALLLSLGAPFWFNLLKSLVNLRPAVAQRPGSATPD